MKSAPSFGCGSSRASTGAAKIGDFTVPDHSAEVNYRDRGVPTIRTTRGGDEPAEWAAPLPHHRSLRSLHVEWRRDPPQNGRF